jgi:hypothetical protein
MVNLLLMILDFKFCWFFLRVKFLQILIFLNFRGKYMRWCSILVIDITVFRPGVVVRIGPVSHFATSNSMVVLMIGHFNGLSQNFKFSVKTIFFSLRFKKT